VVPCRCLENKSSRHFVSVSEAVPTRVFFSPFLRAIAGILVESKAGRCANAKTFIQSNTLEK